MDDNYNPSDEELKRLFDEGEPEADPNAKSELPQANPFLITQDTCTRWGLDSPKVEIARNAMPPDTEIGDLLAAEVEPTIKGLAVGTQVTVTGFVYTLIDKELNLNEHGLFKYETTKTHRAVHQTEAKVLRCLFLGWTQLQCGWRMPPQFDGDAEWGDSYTASHFVPDKYINVAVVMPLDRHKTKFRKPFRCLPSHIIVEDAQSYQNNLDARNRKFNK